MRGVPAWRKPDQILLAAIGILVLLQLLCAMTPLIFYDSLVYQLAAPAQFIKSGGFSHIPWNVYASSPLALQTVVGTSWAIDRSGETFKFLLALLGLLLPLAAGLIISKERTPALLASLLVLSYPEFWIQQTLGIVDLPVAAFLLLGVFWMRRSLEESESRSGLLAGLAFGFAMASRYQGIVLVSCFMAALSAERLLKRDQGPARILKRTALVGTVAGLMVLPWLIRNWIQIGNPVFPLFVDQIGGTEWSALQGEQLRQEVLGPTFFQVDAVQKLLSPVAVLLRAWSNGLLGGAALLCAAVAIARPAKTNVRPIALMGLAGLALWGLIHPRADIILIRFNAASLALLLATAGVVLSHRALWQGVGMLLALSSTVIGLIQATSVVPVWRTLSNPLVRSAFVQRLVPSLEGIRFVNEHLDASKHKVLLIGETRSLLVDAPVLSATAFNGPQLAEIFATGTPEEWLARLRNLGVSHILVNHQELERLLDRYRYLDIGPEQLTKLYKWFHTLPLAFSNESGTAVFVVPTIIR